MELVYYNVNNEIFTRFKDETAEASFVPTCLSAKSE